MIKVSIIIPVYNTKQYLAECLDSVLGQTLKEIEVICVNDGSTDGSLQVLNDYAKHDCRVVVVDKVNEGAGASRNRGLNIAKGECVIFFDSDDFMTLNALETMYERLMSDKSDMLVCRANDVDGDGNDLGLIKYAIQREIIGEASIISPEDYADKIFQIFVGWPWDKLYRRDFVVKNGLLFQNLRHSNDTYFVLMSLVLAGQISCVDDCLMSHRRHGSSISATRQQQPTCFIDALVEMYETMNNKGVYKTFLTSYQNYCVSFAKWHYTTIGSDECRQVIRRHYSGIVNKHKLLKLRREAFHNKEDYDWLQLTFSKKMSALFHFGNVDVDGRIYKQINLLGLNFRIRNKKRELRRTMSKFTDQMNKPKAPGKLPVRTSVVVNKGTGNHIYLIKDGQRVKTDYIEGLNVEFMGNNSIIEIGAHPAIKFRNTRIKLGSLGVVSFGNSKFHSIDVSIVNVAEGGKVLIGENLSVNGAYIANDGEPNLTVSIGNDCQFSADIYLRATDGHSIYDISTKKVLNRPCEVSISIGSHVWLCNGVRVLKNSQIASNTIVGNRAIVTKRFDKEFTAIAGAPAKIVKENVNWDRRRTNSFLDKYTDE